MLTSKYEDKVTRKVFLLAMCKLLEIEDRYFEDIIKQCILYFRDQNANHAMKVVHNQVHIDPKMRRIFQDLPLDNEEMI